MKLLQPTIQDHGLAADHNMPCPVCRKNPAVLDINDNIFQPCWQCQKTHTTIKPKTKTQHTSIEIAIAITLIIGLTALAIAAHI